MYAFVMYARVYLKPIPKRDRGVVEYVCVQL